MSLANAVKTSFVQDDQIAVGPNHYNLDELARMDKPIVIFNDDGEVDQELLGLSIKQAETLKSFLEIQIHDIKKEIKDFNEKPNIEVGQWYKNYYAHPDPFKVIDIEEDLVLVKSVEGLAINYKKEHFTTFDLIEDPLKIKWLEKGRRPFLAKDGDIFINPSGELDSIVGEFKASYGFAEDILYFVEDKI